MTATKSREMTQLLRGILAKYAIDNLACEMDIMQAIQQMYEPKKTGRTPAEIRKAIEQALQIGAEAKTKQQAMMDRAERALLRITYNLRGAAMYEQERFYKHLQEAENHNETIEAFVSWASADAYWHDKISSINKIIELWPKAFIQGEKIVKSDGGGFYG